MSAGLYSTRSNLILGFHGTTLYRADNIFAGRAGFRASTNDYDWLGSGMYFWENNLKRAEVWAKQIAVRKGTGAQPAVVGAVLDLGHCLDLTESDNLEELSLSYEMLLNSLGKENLPKNSSTRAGSDLLIRRLDCAVINNLHKLREETKLPRYDSVRGVFWEGDDLYPNAGFKSKNHIQLCITNPNCIKGFFRPRSINTSYLNV